MSWQYEWSGSTLQNQRILVCPPCLDIPNAQLRSYVTPPDPIPFDNPRIELDKGWPMETGPIYQPNGVGPIRTAGGVVLTTSGGTVSS